MNAAHVSFDGRPVEPAQVRGTLSSVTAPQALISQCGLMYRAALADGRLYVALGPALVQGKRMYHYELPLTVRDPYVLSGCIDPNGTVSLAFRMPAHDAAAAGAFRHRCIELARFFVAHDVPSSLSLDPAARQLLVESGIFAAPPPTLGALARYDFDGEDAGHSERSGTM